MNTFISFAGYNHRKKLVRNAIEWFFPRYIGKHTVDIDIFDKQMNREGTYGACSLMGSYSRPREFEIEMNNTLCDNEYIQALFHELIHIKQWILRQRVSTKGDKNFWYGKQIDDNIEYMDLPWEKEAFGKESRVYFEYLRSKSC